VEDVEAVVAVASVDETERAKDHFSTFLS
jgi:hypothetical protein